MRLILMACLMCAGPAWAQAPSVLEPPSALPTPSASPTPSLATGTFAPDAFAGSFAPQSASKPLGAFAIPTPPPVVMGECVVATDGITPVWCLENAGIKALPVGLSWRADPNSIDPESGPCLWSDAAGVFLKTGGDLLCLDAPLAEPFESRVMPRTGRRLFEE